MNKEIRNTKVARELTQDPRVLFDELVQKELAKDPQTVFHNTEEDSLSKPVLINDRSAQIAFISLFPELRIK